MTIKVRYGDFSTVTRSHTGEEFTAEGTWISERAVTLLGRTEAGSRAVRLLGVGAHGLVDKGDMPPRLLSFDYGDSSSPPLDGATDLGYG